MTAAIFILVGAVAAGGALGWLWQRYNRSEVRLLVTFSGAYLLGIGVFHLLPHIFEHGHGQQVGLFMMGGFVLQLILEWFSKGVEHGHGHREMFQGSALPWGLLISLFIHALLESLPLAAAEHRPLLWAIALHKLPISLILFIMLRQMTSQYSKIILALLSFALIAPLGVWLGHSGWLPHHWHTPLNAVVFGIFLHVSTTILFESTQSHRVNLLKFVVTLGALVLAWWASQSTHF